MSKVSIKKTPKYRNSDYLKWIKTQSCAVTGIPADDPHHITGHNQGGTSISASDLFVFPVTRQVHSEIHSFKGYKQWESIHGSQWKYVVKTLLKAIDIGMVHRELVYEEIMNQVANEDDREYLLNSLDLKVKCDGN